MQKLRYGLGENSRFSACHPMVNFIFYVFVIGITMFSMSPVFLAATLCFSWAYTVLLKGVPGIKTNLLFTIPLFLIMAVVNTLFTHNGKTTLFFINGLRITLEAFCYGLAAAAMLSAIVIWFMSFNIVMSADKLIYLFGKAAPVLGLTLSMVFRFIPLLQARYREISMGQRCMGRHMTGGFMAKLRQTCKEISILISWSLEASIETSDSMEARGYGLPGRTSFHLFHMSRTDKLLLGAIVVTGGITAIGCALGKTSIYFYPVIKLPVWDPLMLLSFGSFCVLQALPLILDITGERKWQ